MGTGCLSQSRAWGRCWAGRDLALPPPPPHPPWWEACTQKVGLEWSMLSQSWWKGGRGPFTGSALTPHAPPTPPPPAGSQVHQPAACHPGHPAPEPQGGPGGAASSGRSQCLAPAAAGPGGALGGRPQGAGGGAGPRRHHPVQVRLPREVVGGGDAGVGARVTTLPPAQGGGARPGGWHGARAAAALPLPRALPAQLRAARQRAWAAAARGAALRRLRLRATRDGDRTAGAARAPHGELVGGAGAGGAGAGPTC